MHYQDVREMHYQIAGDIAKPRKDAVRALDELIERHLVRRSFRFRCPACGVDLLDAADLGLIRGTVG